MAQLNVLITVYNGQETVRESLDSILRQSFKDFDVVIVDDGSTDNTVLILEEMKKHDARINVLQKPHSGIVDSIKFGLEHCKAEFIARFDADDLAFPHRFETQIKFLQQNPEYLAVSSAYVHINTNNEIISGKKISPPADYANPDWVPAKEPFLMQTLLMLRRDALESVGGYRYCEVSEDSDLYWRLSEKGKIVNLDEVLGGYKLNPSSISSKSIVNGRRMAFWSQLVALSAKRRRTLQEDIPFTMERLVLCSKAKSLEDFCNIAAPDITVSELNRFKLAVSVKLLQLCTYRPFEVDVHDCAFVRENLKQSKQLVVAENMSQIRHLLFKTCQRLFKKGKFLEIWTLTKTDFPLIVLHALLKKIFPKWLKTLIKSKV